MVYIAAPKAPSSSRPPHSGQMRAATAIRAARPNEDGDTDVSRPASDVQREQDIPSA